MIRQTVLVIGGAGALGHSIIDSSASRGLHTVCLDVAPAGCKSAEINITVRPDWDLPDYLDCLKRSGVQSCDWVVCVAGSWSGGGPNDCSLKAMSGLCKSNLEPALLAIGLAGVLKKVRGVVLTGAAAALHPTPGMLAYGAIKSGIAHLAVSAAAALPNVSIILLCPAVLDTPANRRDMGADKTDSWTPPNDISEWLVEQKIKSGSVKPGSTTVVIKTEDRKTTFSEQ